MVFEAVSYQWKTELNKPSGVVCYKSCKGALYTVGSNINQVQNGYIKSSTFQIPNTIESSSGNDNQKQSWLFISKLKSKITLNCMSTWGTTNRTCLYDTKPCCYRPYRTV